ARHGHQGRRRVRGAVPRLGQAARAPRDGARLARAEYGRLATAQREFAAEAEKKAEEARLVEAEKAERRRREAQQREARCSRDVAEMQPRCSRGVAGV
ncbi:hypothetical protein EMIHUDRAFT_358407, partial [Emiliania huxleyi CCMP1516]|uniref:Uncharacterized protein n=2 Tax=Emiliania huxleyi TaxID=2903 RepID=A0A0D3IFQ6_EMIH1